MAATANETNRKTDQFPSFRVTHPWRTSNRKHIQPRSVLEDTDETDKSDYPEGNDGKPLRQLVHAVLERCPSLLNILHHTKDDTELGLDSGRNDDTHTTAWGWLSIDCQQERKEHAPFRTNVPIYAMDALSAISVPSAHGAGSFLRVVVSPVKLLSSISRSAAERMRRSAGIRSPVQKVTRSPGTASFARRCNCFPSRIM